jgi:hypothetical protein
MIIIIFEKFQVSAVYLAMRQYQASTFLQMPLGGKTMYNPTSVALERNTPFNPLVVLILLLFAAAALAVLFSQKR